MFLKKLYAKHDGKANPRLIYKKSKTSRSLDE